MIGKYLILLVTIGIAAAAQQVIPVTVYYETLCPDSMKFMTEQVIPTWKNLRSYLRLELVPFGKSNSTTLAPDNIIFSCHHGDNECLGNKYQSCLIGSSGVNITEDLMNFINCLMVDENRSQNYEERVRNCKDKTTVPSVQLATLNNCAKGIDGTNLLLSNEGKTNRAQKPLKSVPSVVYGPAGQILDEAESKKAVDSFLSSVCSRIIENPKPKACEGSGAPITTVGLITLFAAGLVVRML